MVLNLPQAAYVTGHEFTTEWKFKMISSAEVDNTKGYKISPKEDG